MRRFGLLASVALLMVTIAGCKSYQRTRRPRPVSAAPPVVKDEEALPPPRPVPPPPAPAPRAETRSSCGPGGKGPRYDVRGVDRSDKLNVRAAPDAKSDVLGELPPDTTGVIALGDVKKVGPSAWRKVRCGSLVGWVNDRFLDPQTAADRKPAM
jgi:hypothetical protein